MWVVKKTRLIFAILPLLAATACASEEPSQENVFLEVKGSLSVPSVANSSPNQGTDVAGDECFFPGDVEQPDIGVGTQVVLKDSSGSTVGLANLVEDGLKHGWQDSSLPLGDYMVWDECIFAFSFDSVESLDQFFSVQVASREAVSFSRQELESSGANLSVPCQSDVFSCNSAISQLRGTTE